MTLINHFECEFCGAENFMSGIPNYLTHEEIEKLWKELEWDVCSSCGRNRWEMTDLEKFAHELRWLGYRYKNWEKSEKFLFKRDELIKECFGVEFPFDKDQLPVILDLFEKSVRKFIIDKDKSEEEKFPEFYNHFNAKESK